MKERLNYIKDGRYFVGYPVNIKGVTIQAESLEELVIKGKVISKMMLNHHLKTLNQEEPFDLKEFHNMEEWLNSETHELRKKLDKYESIYGEI